MMERPLFKAQRSLAEMKKQRISRVLTAHNMGNFFVDVGQPRGFEFELIRAFEKHLNQGVTRKDLTVKVVVIPLSLHDLIPSLLQGYGDIVAAGLTITPERSQQVRFCDPYLRDVAEIVATAPNEPTVSTLSDLSNQDLYVCAGTSYIPHL